MQDETSVTIEIGLWIDENRETSREVARDVLVASKEHVGLYHLPKALTDRDGSVSA